MSTRTLPSKRSISAASRVESDSSSDLTESAEFVMPSAVLRLMPALIRREKSSTVTQNSAARSQSPCASSAAIVPVSTSPQPPVPMPSLSRIYALVSVRKNSK